MIIEDIIIKMKKIDSGITRSNSNIYFSPALFLYLFIRNFIIKNKLARYNGIKQNNKLGKNNNNPTMILISKVKQPNIINGIYFMTLFFRLIIMNSS